MEEKKLRVRKLPYSEVLKRVRAKLIVGENEYCCLAMRDVVGEHLGIPFVYNIPVSEFIENNTIATEYINSRYPRFGQWIDFVKKKR